MGLLYINMLFFVAGSSEFRVVAGFLLPFPVPRVLRLSWDKYHWDRLY